MWRWHYANFLDRGRGGVAGRAGRSRGGGLSSLGWDTARRGLQDADGTLAGCFSGVGSEMAKQRVCVAAPAGGAGRNEQYVGGVVETGGWKHSEAQAAAYVRGDGGVRLGDGGS